MKRRFTDFLFRLPFKKLVLVTSGSKQKISMATTIITNAALIMAWSLRIRGTRQSGDDPVVMLIPVDGHQGVREVRTERKG
jgi:hypothetical protein